MAEGRRRRMRLAIHKTEERGGAPSVERCARAGSVCRGRGGRPKGVMCIVSQGVICRCLIHTYLATIHEFHPLSRYVTTTCRGHFCRSGAA